MKYPNNTTELLAIIDGEWKALMAVVDKLSPAQMVLPSQGSWSPKDNLAHLIEWMKVMMGHHLERGSFEEVVGIQESTDFNEVNALLFERNRDRSVQDILDELNATYAQVVEKLETVMFADLMKPRDDDDPEYKPVLDFVLGNTSEHFAEHRAIIERALSRRS